MVLSSEKNLYEILEISSTASAAMIKSAYRKLARKYHPDLNGGDEYCVRKFKEITEAYEILSNSEKKKNYDTLRGFYHENSRIKFNEANRTYKEAQKHDNEKQHEESQQQKHRENERFSNVLNDILEGFKKTTSQSRKQDQKNQDFKHQEFKGKQARPEKGNDIYTDVSISMTESIEGTTRTINILHEEICPNCEGRTFLNGAKCPICGGTGEQSTHKKITVKIPAHIKHGSKIRIANEGNRGYNGGKNGDLYLNIKIESNANCQFDGLNIHCSVPITPFEAVLGATIDFQTVKGKVSMKVTPNTNSGQKFRLAGQGLKENGKTGDMIITVNIEIPQSPSAEELRLYKELKNITKRNIRETNK